MAPAVKIRPAWSSIQRDCWSSPPDQRRVALAGSVVTKASTGAEARMAFRPLGSRASPPLQVRRHATDAKLLLDWQEATPADVTSSVRAVCVA